MRLNASLILKYLGETGSTARALGTQSWGKAAQPPASVLSGCVSAAVPSPALQLL